MSNGSLAGEGEVFSGEQRIAKVCYHLVISMVRGLRSVEGHIDIIQGPFDLGLQHDNLTLHMKDGRKLDFFVSNFSTGTSGTAMAIKGTGGIREP